MQVEPFMITVWVEVASAIESKSELSSSIFAVVIDRSVIKIVFIDFIIKMIQAKCPELDN